MSAMQLRLILASELPDHGPEVTLSLKNATVLDIVRQITEQTGYGYKTSDNIVTLFRASDDASVSGLSGRKD